MFSMQQRQRPPLTFATVLLLLASHPSAAQTLSSASACISDTSVIYDAEYRIDDTEVSTLRRYVLCPDTVYDVGYYDDEAGRYVDGMAALDLINPNVEISCGDDGKRSNNCVLRGGELHVFISTSVGPLAESQSLVLSNVAVRGVTFREAESKVVGASAKTESGGIVFEDCVFEDNTNVTAIIDAFSFVGDGVNPREMALVFESCTFDSNQAAVIDAALFGLVWNVEHNMTLRNCDFRNNVADGSAVVDDPLALDMISFVVANVQGGNMSVSGCTFENNVVSLALVYEENANTAIRQDNSATGNSFFATATTGQYCDGFASYIDAASFEITCEEFGPGSGSGSDSDSAVETITATPDIDSMSDNFGDTSMTTTTTTEHPIGLDAMDSVSSGNRPIATDSLFACLLAAAAAAVVVVVPTI